MTSRPIDSRLLHTFAVVAKEGNVSRAAAKLFLSQPAVSLQLKELQALVQLELFTRTPTGVVLTRDGETLLPQAHRALDGLSEFSAAAQRLGTRTRGKLRVGSILDPEFTRLGAFLNELVLHAPDIRPELQHGMSGDTLKRLAAGDIDVGYYVGDAAGDAAPLWKNRRLAFRQMVLSTFSYRVIAPAGWESLLVGRDWAELAKLPWILTPEESAHARLLKATLAPLGVTQNGVALVDQEASMLALVRSGVGLALARESIAIQVCQSEGLAMAEKLNLQTQLCFVARGATPPVDAALAAIARAWRR